MKQFKKTGLAASAILMMLSPFLPILAKDVDVDLLISEHTNLKEILVSGIIIDITETNLGISTQEGYGEQVLNFNDETAFINNYSGKNQTIKDLKIGDKIFAYISPASTRSLPPQSYAFVIFNHVEKEEDIPMYVHLRETTEENDESVSWLNDNQDLIVTINKKTELDFYNEDNKHTFSDIQPGMKALVYSKIILTSFPDKCTADKVLILPKDKQGWIQEGNDWFYYEEGNRVTMN